MLIMSDAWTDNPDHSDFHARDTLPAPRFCATKVAVAPASGKASIGPTMPRRSPIE